MTAQIERIRGFLDAHFPGSALDDGYYFVHIKAPAARGVKDAGLQRVAERMCDSSGWVVAVGLDPRAHFKTTGVEQQTVLFTPDWNVQEKKTEWIAEREAGAVDVLAVLRALPLVGALVLIDPERRVIFDLRLRKLYASSDNELSQFASGIEDALEPPEPTYA